MAKDFSSHQQKIVNRYYEHQDTIRANRLSDLVSEVWLCDDPAKSTKLWSKVQIELMKAGVPAAEAGKVAGGRDPEAFAELVKKIDAGGMAPPGNPGASSSDPAKEDPAAKARGARSLADGRTINQMKAERAAEAGYDSLEEENLKRALKAFRRKLKSMRRDDESQIRGRYTTRGTSSSILAITPPPQFPPAVWKALADSGRLKPAGQGTYQLP